MHLSVLLSSLPADFATALAECRTLGFTHVDVVARVERSMDDLEALADTGLLVSCAALGRDLPAGCTLDTDDATQQDLAIDLVRRQLEDAARLGATHAYLVPGLDATTAGLTRFAHALTRLVQHAAGLRVQLCLEHIPARALPRADGTLAWLEQVPGLELLLDIGHCLISGEDPAAVIARAGARLGYVHLDDNDGVGDLHWPLLSGRLTHEQLASTVQALRGASYTGALTFEFNPGNPEPREALRAGKALLDPLISG